MTTLLDTHWPHLLFVVLGVIAFLWTAYRKPAGGAAVTASEARPGSPIARPVAATASPGVSRRALVALGPLVGALGTGAILYGVNLGGDEAAGSLIWVHVGLSLLALLLVVYKLAAVRRARIRRGLSLQRLTVLISVALGVLFVPLLITGIELLIVPRDGSFAAYGHLVASAWWSGLLLWHLRRYIGPALRAALGRHVGEPPARPAEVPVRPAEVPAHLPAG